eukprot:c5149_g1_i2.p1 GENE.c5149_g1_i2~~c5149_g1_i2.p1  ORF type:complete len:209 (-),score=53.14 c5149_g1_i2:70-696(-)
MKNASNDSNTNNNTHFDNNDNDNGFLSSTLNATPSAEIAGQLSQVLQSMSSISLLELQNWPAQTLPDPEHIVVAATMAHNINLWAESRWEAGFLQKARIQSHTTSQQVEQLIPSEASDFPDTISLDSELVAEGHHQVGHNHHHHDARHAAKHPISQTTASLATVLERNHQEIILQKARLKELSQELDRANRELLRTQTKLQFQPSNKT